MNAHDAIIDAVLTLLRQSPAVTSGLIGEEVDLASLPEGTQEAVSVSLAGSDPQQPAPLLGAPVDWISTVQIECYARRDERTASGRASRELHARVYARLMSGTVLATAVPGADLRQPTIRSDDQPMGTRTGITVGLYPVLHRTVGGALNSPAA